MRICHCGIRVGLASVVLVVAFALLIAPAALAGPSAATVGASSTWSPLPSSLAEVSTTARAAARPAILRLSLTAAKPGARLTITGSGFGARRGKGSVLFGVFKATSYVRWSARKIVCRVPMIPSGRLTLKVRTAGGTSSGKRFTVRTLPTVVPETTDVLTAATLAGASTTDGATYAFSETSETSALAPGDVIVGEPTATLPDGLLRTVTAITDGGKVVLTEPAYLEDAITSGEIVAGHSFTDDDLASAGSLPAGVELVRSRPAADGALLTFRLKGAGATVSGSFNNGIGPVNVSGTVTLRISTKFSCKLSGGKVRSFSCGATTTESSDLRVVVGSNQNYSGGLSLPLMTKVEGFWVGHVPVVIKWGVSLKLGADVEYREGVTAVTHQNVFGSFGLDYQAGQFTKRAVLTTSATSEQPLLARNGSVKGRVGPEVDVRLYGIVGPAVGFDGYLKAEADDLDRPNWKLSAGLEVNASFGVGVGKSIFDIGTSWASDAWTIKEWVLRQGTLDPEPTPTPTPGAGEWMWQNPLPQGNPVTAVSFPDTTHGWAVGLYGTVIVTKDGGATWSVQDSGTSGNWLTGVCFVDAMHGWAVGIEGRDGLILATTDGGATWHRQLSTSGGLFGVAFVSATRGWAVGNSGVFATDDGGATWTSQDLGAIGGLDSVQFVDAQHGWAVDGTMGVLYRTVDGGAHWTAMPEDPLVKFDLHLAHFVDANRGWAADGQYIYATDDGGTTWVKQDLGRYYTSVGWIHFTDASNGWVGTPGAIFTTSDGGAHWASHPSSWDFGGGSWGKAGAICCVDGLWWAASGRGVIGSANGIDWSVQSGTSVWNNADGKLSGIDFADANHGWAVGQRWDGRDVPAMCATSDGGATWTAQEDLGTTALAGVSFPDALHGWVVGSAVNPQTSLSEGIILSTSDGGVTWADQKRVPGGVLAGVEFVDADYGWAVGSGGRILATTDGGANWQTQTSGTSDKVYKTSFVDRLHGWAACGGSVRVTSDGGSTWQAQGLGGSSYVNVTSVEFVDLNHGWAVGSTTESDYSPPVGGIWTTSDGGANWHRSVVTGSGGQQQLNDVTFADATHGWVVGQDFGVMSSENFGILLSTSDGGATWDRQRSVPVSPGLMCVTAIAQGRAWAAGLDGTILATSPQLP